MSWWPILVAIFVCVLSVMAVILIDALLVFTRIQSTTIYSLAAIVYAIAMSSAFAVGWHAWATGFALAFLAAVLIGVDAENHVLAHRRRIGKRTDVYYES